MPRPLSSAARQKAIDAGAELLAEAGIEGFTVDEVARRSGVAKTTLYRHWSSGNELLMAALDCHVERIPSPDTGTLHGDLVALFDTMRQIIDTEGNRQLLLDMMSAAARDPELEQIKSAMMAERTHPIAQIIERAVGRGEIEPIDLDRADMFIHGPFMARTLLRGEPMDRDEVVALVRLVVRGLGGPVPIDETRPG